MIIPGAVWGGCIRPVLHEIEAISGIINVVGDGTVAVDARDSVSDQIVFRIFMVAVRIDGADFAVQPVIDKLRAAAVAIRERNLIAGLVVCKTDGVSDGIDGVGEASESVILHLDGFAVGIGCGDDTACFVVEV